MKDMVAGSLGFAAFAKQVAKNYGVNIALHTDHCPQDKLDDFVLPLLEASEAEVKAGRDPIFNSHMWDGSAETLEENLRIAAELLPAVKLPSRSSKWRSAPLVGKRTASRTRSTKSSTPQSMTP